MSDKRIDTLQKATTAHPGIDRLLHHYLSALYPILGDQFLGLYLHGSLACGDFNPLTSDLDILVVTRRSISAEIFSSLQVLHGHLYNSRIPWAQKLEGAYIACQALYRYDPQHPQVPWLGVDGHFAWERLGSDWIIQRWILREKGLVVSGPPLRAMIAPVTTDDLRYAVRSALQEWWSPPFPSPERFQNGEYLAYTVLTMCRSLFVLENGCPASKPEAARWALKKYHASWGDLIFAASTWKPGATFTRRDDTLALIAFTLEQWELPASC